MPIKLGTLVYVRSNQQTLMLHRIKKQNDMHAGKWNGLGGKLEAGETPEACAIRETYEESGLRIVDPVMHGMITFPGFNGEDDWYTFVFVARTFSGKLIDSNEGVLAWIDDDKLLDLHLWPGDRIFLRWLDLNLFFSGWLKYVDGELVGQDVVFYEGGRVVGERAPAREREKGKKEEGESRDPRAETQHRDSTSQSAIRNPQFAIYTPAEDTYCWMCNGEVVKRHCKIICQLCGFTRDCSDP